MSGRPADWTPLAAHDPVPGAPDAVQAAAVHYRTAAATMRVAAQNLIRIVAMGGQSSDAVAEFRTRAGTVQVDLSGAAVRYGGLADALSGYAPALADAQALSLQALHAAQSAQGSLHSAQAAQDNAQNELLWTTDPQRQQDLQDQHTQARARAGVAEENLGRARALLREATDARDTAAHAASDAIHDAEVSSGVSDRLGDVIADKVESIRAEAAVIRDSVVAAVKEVADVIVERLGKIDEFLGEYSWVLTALQLVLVVAAALVPGVGLIVAAVAVLSTLSSLLAVLHVVVTSAHLVRVVTGEEPGGWRAGLKYGVDLGAVAAGAVAGKALAGAAKEDAYGSRLAHYTEEAPGIGEQFRNPVNQAHGWVNRCLPKAEVPDLVKAMKSADGGTRGGMALSGSAQLATDEGADLVERGADELLDPAAGGGGAR